MKRPDLFRRYGYSGYLKLISVLVFVFIVVGCTDHFSGLVCNLAMLYIAVLYTLSFLMLRRKMYAIVLYKQGNMELVSKPIKLILKDGGYELGLTSYWVEVRTNDLREELTKDYMITLLYSLPISVMITLITYTLNTRSDNSVNLNYYIVFLIPILGILTFNFYRQVKSKQWDDYLLFFTR